MRGGKPHHFEAAALWLPHQQNRKKDRMQGKRAVSSFALPFWHQEKNMFR